MKVVCTCLPALGHFHPMVPVARALADAGHDVVFATARELHAEVRLAGFTAAEAGLGYAAMEDQLRAGVHDTAIPVERQRTRIATEVAPAAMLPDLVALLRALPATLVIHEEGEHAGAIAAARSGIPSIAHGWPAPLMARERALRLANAVAHAWRGYARPAELYLDCCPPSLQSPRIAELASCQVRPMAYDGASGAERPTWIDEIEAPIIYVTSGTVTAFNRPPGLFEAVLDGLRDARAEVVVTVGPGNDPTPLARRFPHARVARYIAQSHILPRCAVVVCHGGASSTTAALAQGVPVLVLPRGAASQRRMGDACAAAGVGRVLDDVSLETVGEAAHALLDDPSYAMRARGVAAAIAEMPAPRDVVPVLERYADLGSREAVV